MLARVVMHESDLRRRVTAPDPPGDVPTGPCRSGGAPSMILESAESNPIQPMNGRRSSASSNTSPRGVEPGSISIVDAALGHRHRSPNRARCGTSSGRPADREAGARSPPGRRANAPFRR